MNNLTRNSMLAQQLLGIGHALKLAGQSSTGNAALVSAPLTSLLQRIHLSTEAGSGAPTDPEAPPKKRRGRPPKAKPTAEGENDTATATPSVKAVSSSGETSKSSAKEPSTSLSSSKTEIEKAPPAPTPAPRRPRQPKPQPFPQGLSTVINPLSPRDPTNWHSGASVADLSTSSSSTSAPPFGFYIDIPSTTLPEAEASFYYDPLLTEEKVKQTHYGCKAATAEFGFSGKRVVMHRPVIAHVLEKAIGATGAAAPTTTTANNKIFVDGWTGAGKSIALYTLAATARASGKVVMYIPAASLLTQGGRFYRRETEGEDEDGEKESVDQESTALTLWDTPEAARHILTAVMNAHADQLATMPAVNSTSNKKQTLAEVATAGLASTSPTEIVEAAITVKDGILADSNGMVIVDEYNALYSHTGYHEPMHQFYRRPLSVDELRLAKSFRILEESENSEGGGAFKGVAVVAPSYGGSISPTLRVLHPNTTKKEKSSDGTIKKTVDVIRVPRFDLNEVSSFAAMSVGTGGLPSMPSEVELRRALALTNGNAKELRETAITLFLKEGPLGVSLGYKAFAVAKKQYNLALEM
jgi:hypothetical protein